ncbi:MAG: hypothetical protein VX519_00575 [Myxococcota bacterium]|nr:hypothetical protein [Myxococcota bacterium]
MQEQPPEVPEQSPQGCLAKFQSLGMAMYAMLLLTFVAAGVTCGLGSVYSLLRSNATTRLGLVSGAEVESWRLAEFRRLELLGQFETPALYHDSSVSGDGSSGCLVAAGRLIAFTQGGVAHATMPLATSQLTTEPTPTGMVVMLSLDNQSATCQFFNAEEGNRFADMLRAEARLAKPPIEPFIGPDTTE